MHQEERRERDTELMERKKNNGREAGMKESGERRKKMKRDGMRLESETVNLKRKRERKSD